MQLTYLKGYPDFVVIRQTFVGFGNGPASYVKGGDPVALPRFNSYIDAIAGNAFSASGNYQVVGIPAAIGPRQVWKAKWLYAGGQIGVDGLSQNVAGSGMTPGLVTPLTFSAGNATGTFTVLTATTGFITITSSGSGYVAPPATVTTTGTGGTPPTFNNLTIGLANGAEVAATTNLSAETIQLCGFCGEF